MSRQNPFMRNTNDRYYNNCQNGYQNNCKNSCNNHPPYCDDRDDCHDKDKNPCVICPPGPEDTQSCKQRRRTYHHTSGRWKSFNIRASYDHTDRLMTYKQHLIVCCH